MRLKFAPFMLSVLLVLNTYVKGGLLMVCEIHNEHGKYSLRFEKHREDEQGNIFTLLRGFECRWNDRCMSARNGWNDAASVSVPDINDGKV